jgi:hypothetical protein
MLCKGWSISQSEDPENINSAVQGLLGYLLSASIVAAVPYYAMQPAALSVMDECLKYVF